MWIRAFLMGLVIAAVALGLGVYTPLKVLEMASKGVIEGWLAAITVIVAVIAGGSVGFIGVILFFVLLGEYWPREPKVTRATSISAYRARQRAMLEELDEITAILKEIRDILKEAGE